MDHRNEPPLFVDISDRRCRQAYLVFAHLMALLAAAAAAFAAPWALGTIPLLLASGFHGYRQEGRGPHPRVLKWNASLGWRLTLVDEDLPVDRLRPVILPRCLLLEVRTRRGTELLFLLDRPDLNQLRHLLRRQASPKIV